MEVPMDSPPQNDSQEAGFSLEVEMDGEGSSDQEGAMRLESEAGDGEGEVSRPSAVWHGQAPTRTGAMEVPRYSPPQNDAEEMGFALDSEMGDEDIEMGDEGGSDREAAMRLESETGSEEGESESGSTQDTGMPRELETESEGTEATADEATTDLSHGHGSQAASDEIAADEEVPALLVYPVPVKRPMASDLAFCFSWADRLLDSLKRLFGEERVLSCLFGHAPLIFSTHFSGLGTAELAVQMLAAAGRRSLRGELRLRAAFSCELSAGCCAVLKQRSPGRCVHANLLDRLGHAPEDLIGRHVRAGRLDFQACCDAMLRSPLSTGSACAQHGGACAFGHVDIDVAGSPCPPWSAAGRRKGREDPRTALTVAWLAWLRHARPRAAIHENVVGFDEKILEELAGDMYFVRSIRMAPSDMGFPFMRRLRCYSLLVRREGCRGTPPASLQALYGAIVRDMAYGTAEEGSLAWAFCAPKEELSEVENAARSLRGHAPLLDGPTSDWTYLLTDAQKARLAANEARSAGATGMRVFDLGQNTKRSSCTASIPTFRCNTAVVWSRELRRWMTKNERLACMVFRCTVRSRRRRALPPTAPRPWGRSAA